MSLSADRVRDLKVLRDGLCTIVSVTAYPADYRSSTALGELRTDLGECYGLYDVTVLIIAEQCRNRQDRVKLDVRTSRAGNRYVKKITPLDQTRNPTPCVSCGTYALLVVGTPEIPSHYACPSCSLMMFQQPITRSYA